MMLHPLVEALGRIVGPRWVRHRRAELKTYTMDRPADAGIVSGHLVMPGTADDVRELVRLLHLADVPSSRAGPHRALGRRRGRRRRGRHRLTRLNRILSVDPVAPPARGAARRRQQRGSPRRWRPSACTTCPILEPGGVHRRGNVAENAGGPHCLKYGVTTNTSCAHVSAADGSTVVLSSPQGEPWGPDLVACSWGARGCSGSPPRSPCGSSRCRPACGRCWPSFRPSAAASEAVSAVIATGIVPAAME